MKLDLSPHKAYAGLIVGGTMITMAHGLVSTLPSSLAPTPFGVTATPRVSPLAPLQMLKPTIVVMPEQERYGIEGPRADKKTEKDPSEDVQAYLQMPESVAPKDNLDGTILVSGWVKSRERTDQNVFDLLNHEESAMKFDKIVAFVNDIKFAKKRLLSRSARYTGLLDKLGWEQASEEDGLPSLEQLEGVKHWVANVEDGNIEKVEQVAELCAKAPSIENVAVLLSGAGGLDASKSNAAIRKLDDATGDRCKFVIVAVGNLKDTPEGAMPYDIEDFGTEAGVMPEGACYSRDESLRAITECLQLESGSNKALTFTEVTSTNTTENVAARLVKGLREVGYTRAQEIDFMVSKGVKDYNKTIEAFRKAKWEKENPTPEQLAALQEERRKGNEDLNRRIKERSERDREREVEKLAREWARRDYVKTTMREGGTGMSEEEWIKKVWDRALVEGDISYRQARGQGVDYEKEMSSFEQKQDKMREVAMKKAQEELEGKLGALMDDDDEDDDDDDDEDDDYDDDD